ncbi:hypothetical protein D3OALGA1CA_624 [Olavius algarvensis associated proteobacterium Delta 3]|nr:hypothetical protein D3OALGA1CA_624 [Olavius algarvensis associated proteobacterium Delta 3]
MKLPEMLTNLCYCVDTETASPGRLRPREAVTNSNYYNFVANGELGTFSF